jgi:MazG family protein
LALSDALLDLQELTERLRRDCPWDREQTARTIVPHTVEEAYEVADAALADRPDKLLDELGDLLFQVYFLALLLDEKGHGDLEQAARGIHDKLVRRHPHVFGEVEAGTAGKVRANWEQIKRADEGREGIFHDVPESLPALIYARKLQRRAAAIEFEYPDIAGALADLEDEVRELKEALEAAGEPSPEAEPDTHVFEELGDVLFAAVNVARRSNVDPELALRTMAKRFADRVERAEELAKVDGRVFTELPLDEQDRYFDAAKEEFG